MKLSLVATGYFFAPNSFSCQNSDSEPGRFYFSGRLKTIISISARSWPQC